MEKLANKRSLLLKKVIIVCQVLWCMCSKPIFHPFRKKKACVRSENWAPSRLMHLINTRDLLSVR